MTLARIVLALALSISAPWASAPGVVRQGGKPSDTDPAVNDPFLVEIGRRLGKHAYFRSVTSTRVDDFLADGLVFVVQRPGVDNKNYAGLQAQEFGPWLRKLEQ